MFSADYYLEKPEGLTALRRYDRDYVNDRLPVDMPWQPKLAWCGQGARFFHYKQILENNALACVWSGREIRSREKMHIDHMIPFSVLRNNDLCGGVFSSSAAFRNIQVLKDQELYYSETFRIFVP